MKKPVRAAFAALFCVGTMTFAAKADAADFVMKISSPAPMTEIDPLSAWMVAFEEGLEKATDGRIDVQLYPASQLGPIPATVEGVAMGTIEMTMPAIGFMTGVDPRFQILDADGLFDDEHHARKTLARPEVRAMLSEFGQKAGVEPLVVWTSGQMILVTREKVASIAGFSGKKIRTAGATTLVNKPFEALGVAPVAMPLGDALPGIQTGQIDGATINLPVAVGFKFADVANQALYLPKKFAIIGGIVSRDFLAQIGPELEAIVRQEAENAMAAFEGKLDSGPATLEKVWDKNGGHLARLDGADREKYLAVTTAEAEKVISADTQLQADYDLLKAAAAAARN